MYKSLIHQYPAALLAAFIRLFLVSFSCLSLACIIPPAAFTQSFAVQPDNTILNIIANTYFILVSSSNYCTNNVRVILIVFNTYGVNLTKNKITSNGNISSPVYVTGES